MLEGGKRVPSIVVAEVLIEGYGLTYVEADLVTAPRRYTTSVEAFPRSAGQLIQWLQKRPMKRC